jgi:hypothetical protein
MSALDFIGFFRTEETLPPILSFTDQELAALRTAAAALLPEQRDRFLKDVAHELRRCREIGPDTVAQVATTVQRRLANGDGARRMRQAQRIASVAVDRHAVRTATGT